MRDSCPPLFDMNVSSDRYLGQCFAISSSTSIAILSVYPDLLKSRVAIIAVGLRFWFGLC